jgi:acyl carrier protein
MSDETADPGIEIVRRALARRLTEPDAARAVAADADLFELGLIDSIGFFDLVVDLEHDFGVRLAAGRLEPSRMRTPAGIAETFTAARAARGPSGGHEL